LVGALSVLEEEGFEPQNVAGASAGAIVATLLAAGYKAHGTKNDDETDDLDLKKILEDQDFDLLMDKDWEDRFPKLIGLPLSIFLDQGIYEGKYFQALMEDLLSKKGVHTFRDLIYDEDEDNELYRYKLQVIVSDITKRRLLVLPRDAKHLGIKPDDLNVALAVRMSMSFPIFFEPVRWKNPETDEEHLLIDGGMLSNYPVWLFDSDGKPEWPTFGLRLVEEDMRSQIDSKIPILDKATAALGPIVPFISNLASTAIEAHDRMYIESANFSRTIPIPTLGVSTLDFDLPKEKKDELYDAGRKAAKDFLDNWNFENYVNTFRSGQKYSRREEIQKRMQNIQSPKKGKQFK
jgi:NTE family protein